MQSNGPLVERWRRTAAGYLAIQAVLGVAWWILLVGSPTVRSWFELLPGHHHALDTFVVADLAVFIGGSAFSGWAVARASRWAPLTTAFTAGGLVYATLCLIGWAVLEGTGEAGIAPMLVASVATTAIAVRLRPGGTP